jgi:chromosome segregation ATPase
MCVC